MEVTKRLILLFLKLLAVEARGVIAQDNVRDKAPKGDRHEFVIANFKTEGGVTLPEASSLRSGGGGNCGAKERNRERRSKRC